MSEETITEYLDRREAEIDKTLNESDKGPRKLSGQMSELNESDFPESTFTYARLVRFIRKEIHTPLVE